MKTAEYYSRTWRLHGATAEEIIRAIQLDAIRHGMTLAAAEAELKLTECGFAEQGRAASAFIITARDNLKELL